MDHKSQAAREALFARAGKGEITGDEADAEAVRLGIGPLSSRPAASAFDPEDATYWTLPMTVAWIAFRTKNAVRDAWGDYRAQCWDWTFRRWRHGIDGPVREGWHLEQRRPASLALLGTAASFGAATNEEAPTVSLADAEQSLWFCLREGMIKATGLKIDTEQRVEIPQLEWGELKPFESKLGTDEVRFGPFGAGYTAMEFPSKGVRRIWPEPPPPVALPEIVPPTGDGYFPLFLAALWIATRGGMVDFNPLDEAVWRPAYADLLAAIASEKVRTIGVKDGGRLPVPAYLFAECRVDYPYANASIEMIMSDDLYLRSYFYMGEEEWRRGFDDALINRYGNHWTRLVVSKEDVHKRWPFGTQADDGADRTGMAGRPGKAKHLIQDELQRRGEAGFLAGTLHEEAMSLLAWVTAKHPNVSRPQVKTTENNIRAEYWRLKKATK